MVIFLHLLCFIYFFVLISLFFLHCYHSRFLMRALKFYSTALFQSLIIKLIFTCADREASKSGAYYGCCAKCLNLFLNRGGDGYWS